MPKVVVSTTLTEPAWQNTTVISAGVPTAVARLKGQYEGDVLVAGSATLAGTLREHDLVDEYRLMVYPVLLGGGKRLFADSAAASDLTLAESRKVGPDVLLLTYRPAGGNRAPRLPGSWNPARQGLVTPAVVAQWSRGLRAGPVTGARARAKVAAPGPLRA